MGFSKNTEYILAHENETAIYKYLNYSSITIAYDNSGNPYHYLGKFVRYSPLVIGSDLIPEGIIIFENGSINTNDGPVLQYVRSL